jgi:hypothetical protein
MKLGKSEIEKYAAGIRKTNPTEWQARGDQPNLRAKYAKVVAQQKMNPPNVESTAEANPMRGRSHVYGLSGCESSQHSPAKEQMRPPTTRAFRTRDGSSITLF